MSEIAEPAQPDAAPSPQPATETAAETAAESRRLPTQPRSPHPPGRPESEAVRRLRMAVRGTVLVRGADDDAALELEAAAWNVAVTHRPTVVVAATCATDVVAAVRFAAGEGLAVAVQGTGHGATSSFRDGVLVTTRRMADVSVDADRRTARVGAGAVWRDVIAAAAPHGLAPLSGSASGVGVAGFTLGGGMGLLSRKHGFAADHVRSLDLVTADGRLRHVDAGTEPDLFWALRGGKGSFGVVTALELGLVELPALTAGAIVYAGEHASTVLHTWREWCATLSDDTSTSVALLRLPDAPMVPEHLRGVLTVHVRVAHLGPQADADRVLAPLRACAPALVDDVVERPSTDADAVHRDPVDPSPSWELGAGLASLDRDAVDALLAVAGPSARLPLVVVELRLMGGAMSREPAPAGAVAGRDTAFSLMTIGPDVPPLREVVPAAARAVHDALAPWRSRSTVTNWLGHLDDREAVCATWSFDQQARLRATKTLYDPFDVFSHGHSVLPSVSPADLAAEPLGVDDLGAPRPAGSRYWDVYQARWVRRRQD
ncbi:MAG: FAD-binding oxidoreductase [Angustibacter sp.]